MNNKYTVLVSSCDAYKDLWEPFFYFLNKNWPTVKNIEIILNTESENFEYKNLNIKTFNLYSNNKNHTWSERLKKHLQKVKTPYVLLLLEDFFIEEEVDENIINFCIEEMEKDKNINHFGFVPTLWESIDDKRYENFLKRKRNTPYRVNTQAGLWKTQELIALIRSHESPWDFETFANIRSRLRKGDYYVAKEGCKQAFKYDWFNGGAVHRGKWTKRAIEMINESKLSIDFEVRGLDKDTVKHPNEIPLKPLEKNIIGRTLIRLNILLKHWRSLI